MTVVNPDALRGAMDYTGLTEDDLRAAILREQEEAARNQAWKEQAQRGVHRYGDRLNYCDRYDAYLQEMGFERRPGHPADFTVTVSVSLRTTLTIPGRGMTEEEAIVDALGNNASANIPQVIYDQLRYELHPRRQGPEFADQRLQGKGHRLAIKATHIGLTENYNNTLREIDRRDA